MFSKLVNKVGSEQGLSMMEVLVIMFTFALISMAVANSAMTGLRSYKFVSLKAAADALAQSKMEQWAAQNPSDLDATDNVTESAVASSSVSSTTFTRQSSIVVNADESRTVTVTVTGNGLGVASRVTATVVSTYSLWSYGA